MHNSKILLKSCNHTTPVSRIYFFIMHKFLDVFPKNRPKVQIYGYLNYPHRTSASFLTSQSFHFFLAVSFVGSVRLSWWWSCSEVLCHQCCCFLLNFYLFFTFYFFYTSFYIYFFRLLTNLRCWACGFRHVTVHNENC